MIQRILNHFAARLDAFHQLHRRLNQLECLHQKTQDLIAENKILSAQLLLKNLLTQKSKNIQEYEFKVFSQWGDDGIIQFLVNHLDIDHKIFIEFGVENYTEANTRFLLINNNWSGLIIDGSEENIAHFRRENLSWKYDLKAVAAFVTKENINQLISIQGISGDIGLLHIDIDGNDYWVWQAINVVSPVIAIIEYNSVFGPTNSWVIPYDPKFNRTDKHYSNLYFGTSLTSICNLARTKGYYFIGCNSSGNNAYFIRKDKIKDLKPLTAKNGFVLSKFNEACNVSGELSRIPLENRLSEIKGLPVYNTKSGKIEKIHD